MLKEWIETGEICSKVDIVGLTRSPAFRLAGVRTTCSVFEIGTSMEESLQQSKEALEAAGINMEGGASAYYHFDMKQATFDYVSGYLVSDKVQIPAGLTEWSTPEVEAFSVIHTGPYSDLGNAWATGYQHIRNAGLPKKQMRSPTFEIYQTDPEETEPRDNVTQVFLPVRDKILGFF